MSAPSPAEGHRAGGILASSTVWAPLALVLLTLAAYANSLSAGLPLDSDQIIGADPRLREISWTALRDIFTRDYWWPTVPSSLYRPLTTLTYWFNYAVLGQGTAPFGYHLLNLLLHVANVLLVHRCVRRIGGSALVAWLSAALFAVHPLGVEAVTNVVGRADLIATGLILVTALAWLRVGGAETNRAAWMWRLIAGATALLAVLAKETGVMAVAAAGLVTWANGGARRTARAWLDLAQVFGPSLVACAAIQWFMRDHALALPLPFTDNPIAHASAGVGVMTAIGAAGRYFALFVWPASLSCDYSYPAVRLFGDGSWATAQPLLALAGFGVAAAGLWRVRARAPLAWFGAAWCAIMMLPTSNLLVKIGSVFAERFFYLPMFGAALIVAVLLERLRSAAVRRVVVAVCLIALGVRTWARNRDWRDGLALWTSAARACPESYKVHKGLAEVLFALGATEAGTDRAIAEAELAVQKLTSPPLSIERDESATRVSLGLYYRVKGQFVATRGSAAEARAWFQRALAVLDDAKRINDWVETEARRRYLASGQKPEDIGFTGNFEVPQQRAQVFMELGDFAAAEENARAAQKLAPGAVGPLTIFLRIDNANGNLDAVAVRLLQIVLLDRNYERAWRDLEATYRQLGLAGAVGRENGAYGVDARIPRVRAQLNTAFVDLVRTFRRAHAHAEARVWVERAVNDYGCTPGLFAEETPAR